ncbi:lysozyme [Nonomuraea soli]|nr:lysozyme [Nonomuraea soli]
MVLIAALAALGVPALSGTAEASNGVPGVDVSNWTGEVDWSTVTSGGGKFAFVHATEGSDWTSPAFQSQYGGAAGAGLVRGAYHFALPNSSEGTQQAEHFLANGGAWVADGLTLPGVLDLEDNPYKDRNGLNTCYNLTPEQMVTWIKDFTTTYKRRTGRNAIIYTTTSWWRTCTADSTKFKANPLWLARWGTEPGELPKGWTKHTFWQSADKGTLVGGQDSFNGTESQLKELANPPAEVSVGGTARGRKTFVLSLANTGPHPLTDIRVDGRAFGGKISKAPKGCKFSGTAVKCLIPKINVGKKLNLVFSIKPKPAGSVGIRFTVGEVKVTLKA